MTKPKSKTQPSVPPSVPAAAAAAPVAPKRVRAPKPPPAPPSPPPAPATKLDILSDLLKRKQGATLQQLMQATGWQAHSVRGGLAGAMKKRFDAKVVSELVDGVRVYRAPRS